MVYVGFYLKVKCALKKESYDSCADHGVLEGAQYCHVCGKRCSERIFETTNYLNAPEDWAYQKIVTRNFYCAHYYSRHRKDHRVFVFIPDQPHYRLNCHNLRANSCDEILFETLDLVSLQEKFEQENKEPLDYLRQWFEVNIYYGILPGV